MPYSQLPLAAHLLYRSAAYLLAITIGSVALVSTPAKAQVNTEALIRDPLTPGLSASLETSLSLSRGNITLFDIGGAAGAQYQSLHPHPPGQEEPPYVFHRGFLTANTRFAERDDEVFIDQGFAHARWTAMWLPRLGTEVFVQYQFNEFLLLNARAVGGGGARAELVHEGALLLSLGTGYMLEYERIDVPPGAPDEREQLNHRVTSYLSARASFFAESLLLQNVVYFQPRIDEPGDFRLLEELELSASSNEWLSIGLKVGVYHDSRPPSGVEKTDLRLTSTIRLGF